ncbi:MAG: PAS domain S-box protein, partial [Candidatus Cloacimonadota bacterium]|nr:PAS domain S-box protein [Candidatus Cloacimonadota bacterium]
MQETINIGSDKILDCLNSAVIRTDANGNILSYNKTANRYIFKNKSNNIRQIIHRKSINNFDRYFQSLAWRESLSFELRIDNATDGFVWCNLRAARLDNEQIVFQIWDITRRKQIEEYFMASEKKFRSLFGFSNDGIVFIDSKNKVVEWNKSMENISGWKSDEAVGNTISNIFKKLFTKNSKLQKIMKKIENFATIEDEDLVSAEINIDSKPSKILQLSFFSITGDNSYGMIARDVTKIKEAEKSLKKMNKKLEQRVEEELQKREQQQQLLMQKSKLESLGKLAAGI